MVLGEKDSELGQYHSMGCPSEDACVSIRRNPGHAADAPDETQTRQVHRDCFSQQLGFGCEMPLDLLAAH